MPEAASGIRDPLVPMGDRVACKYRPVFVKATKLLVTDQAHRPERNVESTGRMTFRQDEDIVFPHHTSLEMEHGVERRKVATDMPHLGFVVHLEQAGSRPVGQRMVRTQKCLPGVRHDVPDYHGGERTLPCFPYAPLHSFA